MAKKKEETPEEQPPEPKPVPKPGDVTEETVEKAEEIVEKAEAKIEAAPPSPEKDQVMAMLREIKEAIMTLFEKVERHGGIVEKQDLTPKEEEIREVAAPGRGDRFLSFLDSAIIGSKNTGT